MKKIIIIDDDIDTCSLLSHFLNSKGFTTETAYSGKSGLQKVKGGSFDVAFCDYRLGDCDGIDVLKEIKRVDPKVNVIIITGYTDINTAVKVIKEGAFDYISKPLIPDEVLSVIQSIPKRSVEPDVLEMSNAENSKTSPSQSYLSSSSGGFLRGKAPSIKKVYKEVDLIAGTNYNVILTGESGTGKEVIARTIHQQSQRVNKRFIAVDCGTLSKELAGSELFGHVKGAFTGALADKTGYFELANGGTLFLDEVSNLPYDVQASLLRIVQERKLKRIGGTRQVDLDVRILVASNEDLENAYKDGKFREDLYHRLNEFSISLPPLRERREDIPLFARFFLEKVNGELKKNINDIDGEAMESMKNYSWPGNIREMKNVVRRATLLASDCILSENLPWQGDGLFIHPLTNQGNPVMAERRNPDLKQSAHLAEYETVMSVLKKVNYNKSKAAHMLKIDRKTLYNKLKKFEDGKGNNFLGTT